ncbi:MAG: T9SS type A sorting domain-containing protein, partial [Pseudoflavonifractor sp.]|nr:T9SS type A sorting domain-containing protein [Pseudoflavonifractor sp.]
IIGPGVTTDSRAVTAERDSHSVSLDGRTLRLNAQDDVTVNDLWGRCMLVSYGCQEISLVTLSPGIYVVRTSSGVTRKIALH